ncbi:MAG TPA: hypothetical protein VF826_17020 [Chloroflexia bacterium]
MGLYIRNIVRIIASGFDATRYSVVLALIALVLIYAGMSELNWLPPYTSVASWLGVSSLLLLLLIYLALVSIAIIAWYFWIVRPTDSIRLQMRWKGVYRQTDRTGLVWVDLVLLVGVVAGAILALLMLLSPVLSDPALVMALALTLAILLDFLPGQRPRRVALRPGQTLRDVAEQVTPSHTATDRVLADIWIYNELDPTDRHYNGPELPEGMFVEVPPRS